MCGGPGLRTVNVEAKAWKEWPPGSPSVPFQIFPTLNWGWVAIGCWRETVGWGQLLPLLFSLSLGGLGFGGGVGYWGVSGVPTFSLVDIWYPRGRSVSPPGHMIFLSLGMTWGWEYEMEGGHAGVLAPGP